MVAHPLESLEDLLLVSHVGLQREITGRVGAQIHPDDGRALALEHLHRRGADATGGAGHDAHAPLEPARWGHHPSVA